MTELSAENRRAVAEVLNAFRLEKGAGLELELRFQKVTRSVFEQVYNGLREQGAVFTEHQTINCITSDRGAWGANRHPGNNILTAVFVGGHRTATLGIRKVQLVAPAKLVMADTDFSLVLSQETPIDPPSITADSLTRFKLRRSTVLGSWRVDLTAVHQTMGLNAGHSAVVDRMFRSGEFPPADPISWEMEAEWTAADSPPTEAAIVAIAARLTALVSRSALAKERLEAEVRAVAKFTGATDRRAARLKQVLPQVKPLTRAHYRTVFPPAGYFVLPKTDGVRAVGHVMADRSVIVGQELLLGKGGEQTVVDGELVGDTFYAFDVVAQAGTSVARQGYEQRVMLLPAAVAALRAAGFRAEAKPYEVLKTCELEEQFRAVLDAKYPYAVDGLILVKPGAPYDATETFKWKRAELTTIDFLVRKNPNPASGTNPASGANPASGTGVDKKNKGLTEYLLFVGISVSQFVSLGFEHLPCYAQLFPNATKHYFPVHFTPASEPRAYRWAHENPDLDGQVVELAYTDGAWQFHRIRNDRADDLKSGTYWGNDYSVAISNWLSVMDPFPAEQLWTGPTADYFQNENSRTGVYEAQIMAVSQLKESAMQDFLKGAKSVLDLACGKGQDLGRYRRLGLRSMVGVDQDRAALAELVRRLHSPPNKAPAPFKLAVIESSLLDPGLADRVLDLGGGPLDAAVCNLAIHYFLQTNTDLEAVAIVLQQCVAPGGYFLCTCLLGELVHAKLAETAGVWSLTEDESVRKFSIRRDYEPGPLAPAGQQIGVLLPFSQGEYYEEYLVPTATLKTVFEAHGFKHAKLLRADKTSPKLTAADREYLELFGCHVFRRDK